jgi:hypothetical protein
MAFSNEDFTSSIIQVLYLIALAFMPKTPPYLK